LSFTAKTLHITNGDIAANLIQDAGIEGAIIPWRDVLHEGPVPFGMSLEELSKVRAEYIASRGWENKAEVLSSFHERDQALENFKDHDQLVLWFEHDLYDQLQIIQILAYLATRDLHKYPIKMICTEAYLGMQSIDGIKALVNEIQPVSYEMITIATTAWQVFTLNSPKEWFNLLEANTDCLPFLKGAVKRLLQEYPDSKTGLTQTQKEVLQIVNQEGSINAHQVFNSYQQQEERRFMGDVVFWGYVSQMLDGENAVLKLQDDKTLRVPVSDDQVFSVTEKGKALINGEYHWPGQKELDRWIGGVHLKANDCWFWDNENEVLIHHSV